MKTILAAVALCLVGCGVGEAEFNHDVGDDEAAAQGELGTGARSYVVVRRDRRRCMAPLCGGYWAHDVNRASLREHYISALDFSAANLSQELENEVAAAPDFEVVLFGKLGPAEARFHTRPFLVSKAWRGMPGVAFNETVDTFYKVESVSIQCIAAPCPSLEARRLHSGAEVLFHGVDVARAAKPLVDQSWLRSRVVDRGALVAGRFVDGPQVGVGREKVLDASQVFVKLPEVAHCPRMPIVRCPPGQVNLYARNDDRCLIPAGCGGGGVCTRLIPTCSEGYTLASWASAPGGCDAYACDPNFLFQ